MMERKEATLKRCARHSIKKNSLKHSIYDSQVSNASSYGPTFPMMSAILDSRYPRRQSVELLRTG